MPIRVKDTSTPMTPAPEGLYQAVCVDVVDLGIVKSSFGDKHKVAVYWQIDQLNEESGKRFLVTKRYTASLSEKATLRKDLETWRSKKFTKEELDGFDLEVLLGVNCQIQIVHNASDDGTVYANVQAVVPIGKGMTKMRPESYVRKIDREKSNGKPTAAEEPDTDEPTPF